MRRRRIDFDPINGEAIAKPNRVNRLCLTLHQTRLSSMGYEE
jgi:hypothetical protein